MVSCVPMREDRAMSDSSSPQSDGRRNDRDRPSRHGGSPHRGGSSAGGGSRGRGRTHDDRRDAETRPGRRSGGRRDRGQYNDRRRQGGPRRDDRRKGVDRRASSQRHSRLDNEVEEEPLHPGLQPRDDEPMAPLDFDEKALPASVKAELRGVPSDTAHIIAGHLVAASELIDENPELANAHAQAARRRAARLPVLREVAADTAYAAGDYASALNDYRALRRMTGNDNYVPVMADCERALGRPLAALKLIGAGEKASLSGSQQVELVLVKAGAREDLGQHAEARRLLREAITTTTGPTEAVARLHYAFAEILLADGDEKMARRWFASAESHDPGKLLDAQDRVDVIDGLDPAPEDEVVLTEIEDDGKTDD